MGFQSSINEAASGVARAVITKKAEAAAESKRRFGLQEKLIDAGAEYKNVALSIKSEKAAMRVRQEMGFPQEDANSISQMKMNQLKVQRSRWRKAINLYKGELGNGTTKTTGH